MKKLQRQFDSPLPGRLGLNPAVSILSRLYSAGVKSRQHIYDTFPALSHELCRPVISVGGIRAGGTGKTPVSQLVGQYLIDKGYGIAFLSRGYGRPIKKPVIVKPGETANWELTGDEPCMIHRNLPQSWLGIGADRVSNAKKIIDELPQKSVFILDDGFQHQKIKRDLDIVCLSEKTFCDRMIPAGFLREPVSSLSRADLLFIIGSSSAINNMNEIKKELERRFDSKKCMILLQEPLYWVEGKSGRTCENAPLKNPLAVCAIARPHRFIDMLKTFSIEPCDTLSFKDHHILKINDFTHRLQDVYSRGIVTTEKDYIRLQAVEFASAPEIWYLKIGLRFADESSRALFESEINKLTL
ncbi:MAG: tetraacyldisaccharide 4'-kinase [Chitinispirillia bacterium]|nr:tetraacyldisaccharide 4'-kinase [Chitinispirillia bacterium]